jgi:hypothetical protein
VYRQVGNKNKAPLSKMKLKNKLATWAIIGKNINPSFIPDDEFVCNLCAGKVRYAQSVIYIYIYTGIRVLEVNHNEGARSKLHVDAHRHMDETCALLCRRRRGQEGSGHQV